MVPKDGGNRFSGCVYADFTHEPWSASNLTDHLKARGINDVAQVYRISDFNPGFGGPIRRDKVWFYAAYRYEAGRHQRRRQLLRQEPGAVSL